MEDLELTGCPEWVDDNGTPCRRTAEVKYTIPSDGNAEELKMVDCITGQHRMLVPIRYLAQFELSLEQELGIPVRELL